MLFRSFSGLALTCLAALTVGWAPTTFSRDAGATGLVAAAGPPLIVTAPAGWVVDDRPGAEDGIPLVLYPSGGSFEKSPVVIYVRTFPTQTNLELADFVRDDVARLRARTRRCRVTERPAPVLSGGTRALLREFSNDRWGNSESVAYLESEEGFVTVVLSARDRKGHDAAASVFTEVLENLRFVGEDRALRALVAAYRAADQNLRTPEGEAFDARIGQGLAKTQSASMRDCAGGVDGSEPEAFDLLIRLGADGGVEEVLARPETRAANCMRSALAKAKLNAPPRPSYWVRLAMSAAPPRPAKTPPVADSSN